MSHAGEGSLQAYLDGELDSAAAAELDRHLVACPACAAELADLRALNERTAGAIGLLLAPPAPVLQARAALARARTAEPARSASPILRLGGRSLAKAAMLLLALAGAGAAAIPGSPVRRVVEGAVARVAQWLGSDTPVAVQEPQQTTPGVAPERPVRTDQAGVAPSDGQVRFVLLEPAAPVELIVSLSDAEVARVETAMEDTDVTFRTRAGLIQVSGLGSGTVHVRIPRSVPRATVELGGRAIVSKQGDLLRTSGPGAAEQGEEVRLRIGT